MKIKRLLSITLVLAIVFTTMAFADVATVSADGWTDVSQDFDTLEELNSPGFDFSGASLETLEGGNKVVKIPENAWMQINLGNISTGQYIARATVLVHGTAQRFISFFITSGGNQSVVCTQPNSTNLYMTNDMNGTAAWYNSATYSADTWYDIESYIDVDAKSYSVKVMNGDEVVAYRNGLPLAGNLNNFRITSWNGGTDAYTYVDKMEFVKADAPMDAVVIDEDFSKYTTVNGTPVSTSVAHNGWTSGTNGTLTTTEAAISDGTLAIQPSKIVRWQTPGGLPSNGKIRISTSINPGGASNDKIRFDILKSTEHNVSGSGVLGAMFSKNEGQIWTYVDGGEESAGFRKYRLAEYEAGMWYDISMVLDMTTNKYSVQVSHDGVVLGQLRDIPFSSMSIYGVQVTNWNQGVTALDNFKIEYITYETDADRIMTADDFSKVTADNYMTYGWSYNDTFGTVTENNYATLSGNNTADITRFFGGATTGKYKLSFSTRLNGGKLIVSGLMKPTKSSTDKSAWGTHGPQMVQIEDGHAHHRYTWAAEPLAFAEVANDQWYDVEVIFDMDKKVKEIIITDANGNEESSGVVPMTQITLPNNPTEEQIMESAAGITHVAGICFRNWNDNSVDIDNVMVEYYVPKPEISAKRITFTDMDGVVAENVNAVNPALDTIALDFGTVVTADSAADITVTGGTRNIIWDGEVSGNKYILTPNLLLEEGETYTIYVPDTVGTDAGTFLGGGGYTFEFTAGEAVVDNKITAIVNTTQNKAVASVGDIAAGDTITISTDFINPTADEQDVTWIIAYYGEDGLVYKSGNFESTEAISGAKSVEDQTFVAPDMTGVTAVKVFLWDFVEGLKPYSEAILID